MIPLKPLILLMLTTSTLPSLVPSSSLRNPTDVCYPTGECEECSKEERGYADDRCEGFFVFVFLFFFGMLHVGFVTETTSCFFFFPFQKHPLR